MTAARHRTRAALHGWGLEAIADACETVVSELVTNAVRAAAGITGPDGAAPPVRLRITFRDRGVLVEVWDASPDMPRAAPAGPDSVGGRGLVIVAALSARCGAYATRGGGKSAWALITT